MRFTNERANVASIVQPCAEEVRETISLYDMARDETAVSAYAALSGEVRMRYGTLLQQRRRRRRLRQLPQRIGESRTRKDHRTFVFSHLLLNARRTRN
jgi:hypothetical protein